MVAQRSYRFNPDEYLKSEREAEYKSEYLYGDIYAMSGSTPNHSAITANLSGSVVQQLRGCPCRPFSNDLKVQSGDEGLFAYPDFTVVCGEPEYRENADVLLNPAALFEVLSPSTEAYDRGRKFALYQTIASLTDYVLVAQDEPRIDHFARQTDSRWLLTTAIGLDAHLELPNLGITLLLRDIYDRIVFSASTGK